MRSSVPSVERLSTTMISCAKSIHCSMASRCLSINGRQLKVGRTTLMVGRLKAEENEWGVTQGKLLFRSSPWELLRICA